MDDAIQFQPTGARPRSRRVELWAELEQLHVQLGLLPPTATPPVPPHDHRRRMPPSGMRCATSCGRIQRPELALWLDAVVLLEVTDTTAIVGTPNMFVRDAVQAKAAALVGALRRVVGQRVDVTLVVDGCW